MDTRAVAEGAEEAKMWSLTPYGDPYGTSVVIIVIFSISLKGLVEFFKISNNW